MNNVAVLYIHGINVNEVDYHEKLHSWMTEEASFLAAKRDGEINVVAKAVCWWDVFDTTARMMKGLTHNDKFGWLAMRDVVLTTAAQAVGYEDGLGRGHYELVHERITEAIRSLEDTAGPDAPLVIVAHSLGSVIASNYIWDVQKNRIATSKTRVMETLMNLRGLITMGSPLALYASRYEGFGQAIDLRGAPWLNLLYPSDVIAWPLRELNASYHRQVTDDIILSPGSIMGRTPVSHMHYWGSQEVADMLGDMVFKVWKTRRRG